jgi:hypothetical protein
MEFREGQPILVIQLPKPSWNGNLHSKAHPKSLPFKAREVSKEHWKGLKRHCNWILEGESFSGFPESLPFGPQIPNTIMKAEQMRAFFRIWLLIASKDTWEYTRLLLISLL